MNLYKCLKNSKEEKKYICRKVFDEKNGYFIVEKKRNKGDINEIKINNFFCVEYFFI